MRLMILLFLLLAPAALAGGRAQLAGFTRGLEGLDGRFEQRVYDPDGNLSERSSGTVMLRAPRLFRWEVQAPAAQLIVADGDHIWIYDPDLEQVTVRTQSLEEQGSPLTVLVDPGELERQFHVREGKRSGDLEWLLLTPKRPEEAPFREARLGFGTHGLVRMEFGDALGQRTVIGFSRWNRNPHFPADAFRFRPPEGVDVVGETRPGAEAMPLQD